MNEELQEVLEELRRVLLVRFHGNIQSIMKAVDENTAEMIQVKHNLGRTQPAERVHRLRKAQKNSVLKTRGVLTVTDERKLVRKMEESEVTKARGHIKRGGSRR